ncbi:MAG: hypothetical protein H6817_10860 [Phycisphaerales bacterium]|nr:hypothetical protein [Phycisphaerales bacterium]
MLTAIRKCFALLREVGKWESEKVRKGESQKSEGRRQNGNAECRRDVGAGDCGVQSAECRVQSNDGRRTMNDERGFRHSSLVTRHSSPATQHSSFSIQHSSSPSVLPSAFCVLPSPSSLADVPPEDPLVYDMICHADTVGVFQIESRAQMSMLPRLQPRCFYDLVIEVAIVRPGPIQGGMVHPYLRRRRGEEKVSYPSDAVRDVLRKTLGVPLFQEQAMKLAVVAAGFSPGEADRLRRSMAAWKRNSAIDGFRDKLVRGMLANGYSPAFAEQLFNQIRGFGEYGFPESHAASFALLVYVSAWLKRYHPAAFAAALINSQPMGFYAPAQLVRDAREHGVTVRGIDVNFSGYDCTLESAEWESEKVRRCESEKAEGGRQNGNDECLMMNDECRRDVEAGGCEVQSAECRVQNGGNDECGTRNDEGRAGVVGSAHPTNHSSFSIHHSSFPADLPSSEWGLHGPALRLGFRLIKGVAESAVAGIVRARRDGLFRSVADVARRSGASRAVLARLAAGDAFGSLGLSRREALWQVLALEEELPLFAGIDADEPLADLPRMRLDESVVRDYESIGLSLRAHPMELIRPQLRAAKILTARQVNAAPQGRRLISAGLVLIRQRPSTALGIVFMTLEDETGVVNLVIRPKVYERYRAAARTSPALVAQGRIEREGQVVHVQVERLTPVTAWMEAPAVKSRDFR